MYNAFFFFLRSPLAELGLDLKTQCMCVPVFLSHRWVFSLPVLSLHALRFFGWLGSVFSSLLISPYMYMYVPWPSYASIWKLSACACLSSSLTVGFLPLPVIPLHALRLYGWPGKVAIPHHPSLLFKFVVSFFSRHTFFHLLPGIWQYLPLDHGSDEQSRTYP